MKEKLLKLLAVGALGVVALLLLFVVFYAVSDQDSQTQPVTSTFEIGNQPEVLSSYQAPPTSQIPVSTSIPTPVPTSTSYPSNLVKCSNGYGGWDVITKESCQQRYDSWDVEFNQLTNELVAALKETVQLSVESSALNQQEMSNYLNSIAAGSTSNLPNFSVDTNTTNEIKIGELTPDPTPNYEGTIVY